MLIEEWNYLAIEHIGCDQGVFAVIALGKRHLGISIDEGLLVNPANAFQVPHVKGVLSAKITGMFRFDLTFGFLRFFGLFPAPEAVSLSESALPGQPRLPMPSSAS